MNEAPEGYDINQAYNDIIYLGARLRFFENFLEELLEAVKDDSQFQTHELFKHMTDEYVLGKALKPYHVDKRINALGEEMDGLKIHYTTETIPKVNELYEKKNVKKKVFNKYIP